MNRYAISICFLLVLPCFAFLSKHVYAEIQATPPLGLVINEDNSHFFGTRSADQMTVEGLNAFIDQYAGTKVTHLFLNPNAMRASFRSTSRDAIWDAGTQEMPAIDQTGGKWVANARLLHERGLDPYAVWIARCREKGIVPWITMRMNDIHDVTNPKNFMHSSFWVQHPEFRRVPNTTSKSWIDYALDYGHPEVREHAMALVRELLERYDPDGLELDWMRFGYHFAPGKEKEGVELLTAFMRDVRTLTNDWSKKRDHPIKLGARVPTHPDAARGLGMDGVQWVKEGLVDMLVPTPFWTSSDFDIPFDMWRAQIGDNVKNVVLAAGLEYNTRACPDTKPLANDLEAVRGFSNASFHRGADQIYLFNFMDSETIPVSQSDYRILLEKGMGRKEVARLPQRYIVAYHDTVPVGFPNGAQLPFDTRNGATVKIYTGPVPKKGTAVLLIGIADHEGIEKAQLDVSVNGKSCITMEDHPNADKFPNVRRGIQVNCPLKALKPGYNEFTIKQNNDGAAQRAVWVELRIDPSR